MYNLWYNQLKSFEDFIDKNEIDENSITSKVDCKISKIEELRTSYRKLHNELKILSEASYEELYERDKERQLSLMKDYIKKGNNLKKYAAAKKSEADIKVNISKARSEMFLVQEVKTSISYLQEIFKVDVSNINDEMTKSKVERMTCQNTWSSWIIYQKRCRIYLNVPIQWLKIKLKILLEATIISKN